MRVKLEKIRRYFQEKRKPLVLLLLPFSLFSLVFLLTPRFTHAAPSIGDVFDYTPLGILTNVTKDAIGEHLAGVYLAMAESLFKGGIWAVNAAISFTSSFINSSNIFPAWQKVRDLSLSLFGIAVLAIAFMNLLRLQIQVWGVNRMIPKLLLGIFLVIFSKFICISIINFATALANTFKDQLTSFDTFNKLLDNSGLSIFFTGPGAGISLPAIAGVFWFSAIAFLVFLLLAIILFFRAVVLGLLIVVSPLAFALTVLPWTQKYFQEWWKTFLKWTFFFPVCILILGVGFSLIPGGGSQPTDKRPSSDQELQQAIQQAQQTNQPAPVYFCGTNPNPNNSNDNAWPPGCVPKYPLREGEADNSSADEFFAMMVSMFVALVAVVLSVFLPLKMLGAFGAVAQDVLSGKKGIPGARIDPKAIRDWGAARSKKIAARKTDRFGRMMRRPFGGTWVGEKITGEDTLDKAALRDEKAGLIKNNLSVDQQRLLAQNRGNVDALRGTGHELSDIQKQWYRGFTSRGGGYEDVIRNLANTENLNHETASNADVQQYLGSQMDLNTALKKSNLHHLRNDSNYRMGNLSDEQLGKMLPSDIKRLQNLDGVSPAFATMIANSRKMAPAQKQAFAGVMGANGRHEEQAIVMNALGRRGPTGGGGQAQGGGGSAGPTGGTYNQPRGGGSSGTTTHTGP